MLSIGGLYLATQYVLGGFGDVGTAAGHVVSGWNLFLCGIVGLVLTGLIVWITEYYTGIGFRPVKSISQASVTGHGTNVIQGLACRSKPARCRRSPSSPASSRPTISGPLRHRDRDDDDARPRRHDRCARCLRSGDRQRRRHCRNGGTSEEVRRSTDALDAVGNTTKAVTKGYAIGSAGLGALVLFAAYSYDLHHFITEANAPGATGYQFFKGVEVNFGLDNPYVVSGLLLGGLIPFLFGGLAMTAVGRAAGSIVEEVRRQFKANPGIMKGTSKPDYARAVDLLTRAAIKEMIAPSLLPVLSPIVLFFVISWIAGKARPSRPSAPCCSASSLRASLSPSR